VNVNVKVKMTEKLGKEKKNDTIPRDLQVIET
jgi:hypothetical protein